MARHKKTKTHKRMELGEEKRILCKTCPKEVLSRNWEAHLKGDRHRKQLTATKRFQDWKEKS